MAATSKYIPRLVIRNLKHSLLEGSQSARMSLMQSRLVSRSTLQTCTASNRPSLFSNMSVWKHERRTFASSSCLKQIEDDRSGSAIPPKRKLPATMNFPHIVWPGLFKTIHNWIQANFVITPHLDPDFSLRDFISGSTQAFLVVANKLANSKFDELEGLVEPDAIRELRQNVSNFTVEDRNSLAVNIDDVYLSFPYQIGIMFNDKDNGVQQRFVEITMCYHVFRGLAELRKREDFQLGPTTIQQYRDRITVANYRFIREYTKGVEDSWTINVASHFRLDDESD